MFMEFLKKKKDLSVFDEKPVAVKELEVILTQKCNLACTHCMRGCSTNKQITEETLDALFEKIYYVDNLSLGGGEPSLAADIVRILTRTLKKHNVIVPHINFTSNGIIAPDEFISALLELKEYAEQTREEDILFRPIDKNEKLEPLYACFSFDDYHLLEIINGPLGEDGINVLYQNIAKYQNALSPEAIQCRLSCDVDIYALGRAKELNPNENEIVPPLAPNAWIYPYIVENSRVTIGGVVTVSVDGEIVPPNISFADEQVLSYGNIKDLPLSKIFARMRTKKVSSLMFDFATSKMMKKNTSSNKKWKKYLKSYGKKKYDIFYGNVDYMAQQQKQ